MCRIPNAKKCASLVPVVEACLKNRDMGVVEFRMHRSGPNAGLMRAVTDPSRSFHDLLQFLISVSKNDTLRGERSFSRSELSPKFTSEVNFRQFTVKFTRTFSQPGPGLVILSFYHRSLRYEFWPHLHGFFDTQGATAKRLRSATASNRCESTAIISAFGAPGSDDRANSVCHRLVIGIFALSGEGVPALHSVIATGPGSRHGSEFSTSKHCRFAGLRPAAQAILGALKCEQNGI